MKKRALVASALDVGLGFGFAAIFELGYGLVLGWLWPYIFDAQWPFVGSHVAMLRARLFDAVVGGAYGALLAVSAREGWIRRPDANILALALGVILYWTLSAYAYGASSIRAALLETPMPWIVAVLFVTAVVLNRHSPKMGRYEV